MRCWLFMGLQALVWGCGASATAPAGTEHEVERSRDERPEWLGAPTCPEGKVCAVGSRTRAAAVEHGRTDAYNDALKDFARRLETRAKSQFSQAREEGALPTAGEAPDLDQAIKEFFVAASRLKIRDVEVADFWWRRYRVTGSGGQTRYFIDYSVHLTLERAAWRRAVQALLERERSKANRGQHRALVKALDDFAADIFEDKE